MRGSGTNRGGEVTANEAAIRGERGMPLANLSPTRRDISFGHSGQLSVGNHCSLLLRSSDIIEQLVRIGHAATKRGGRHPRESPRIVLCEHIHGFLASGGAKQLDSRWQVGLRIEQHFRSPILSSLRFH